MIAAATLARRARLAAWCLTAVPLTLAASSKAASGPMPGPVRSIPIYATVSGIQTTKWDEPWHYVYKNSFNLWWHEGSGEETVQFHTRRAQKGIAYTFVAGETPEFAFGSFRLPAAPDSAMPAVGSVSRTGSYRSGAQPGPDGGGSPTKTTGGDCGTIPRRYTVSVDPQLHDRIEVVAYNDETDGVPSTLFQLDKCPIVVGGSTVRSGSFTDISEKLPAARLFAGKTVVVHAHQGYFFNRQLGFGGHVKATTDVRWTLTLQPVHQMR